MNQPTAKSICPSCGGSGQISFFQGASRFLLSSEECPECSGLGYLLPTEKDTATTQEEDNTS